VRRFYSEKPVKIKTIFAEAIGYQLLKLSGISSQLKNLAPFPET